MKKSSDVNNSPIMLLIMGVIFAGIGIACAVMGFSQSNGFMEALGGLFFAVGAIILMFGILKAIKHKNYKKLYNDPNAHVAEAKFIRSKMSSYSTRSVDIGSVEIPTSINVYKKIIYSYIDETGVEHTVKSMLSYTPNQVQHLENLKTFKVKCNGKHSAIIEDVPDEKRYYNV